MPSLVDRFAAIVTNNRSDGPAQHLASACVGGAVHIASPRGHLMSPRFMRPTAASVNRSINRSASGSIDASAGGRPMSPRGVSPAAGRDSSPGEVPAEGFMHRESRPAGGLSNNRHQYSIDFSAAGQKRHLKRSLSLPRSRTFSLSNDADLVGKDAMATALRKTAERRAAASNAVQPSAAEASCSVDAKDVRVPLSLQLASAPLTAQHSVALPSDMVSTHDKSIPNTRRTRRGSGICLPRPVAVTPEALAAAPPTMSLVSDRGFSSTAMPRRARGSFNSSHHQPSPIPVPREGVGVVRDEGAIVGLGSSKAVAGYSPSRRGRGSCSPQPVRRSAPFEWL